MDTYRMWIGGAYCDAESGKTYGVTNPATGEEIARAPLGDKSDVDKAVDAATRAYPEWSGKSQQERSATVHRIAALLNSKNAIAFNEPFTRILLSQ